MSTPDHAELVGRGVRPDSVERHDGLMVLSHISQNDGMIEAIVDTVTSDTNTALRRSSSTIMSRRAARVYDFLEATLVELYERWRALQSYQEDKLELFRLNCESELFLRLVMWTPVLCKDAGP